MISIAAKRGQADEETEGANSDQGSEDTSEQQSSDR